MTMRSLGFLIVACLTSVSIALAAGSPLDIVPAVGGAPVHLRMSLVSADPQAPRIPLADVVLRRTGAATAVLQRGTDVTPLTVDVDGSLHLDPHNAPPNIAELTELITTIDIAHSVLGVTGAGDRNGWIAQVPAPVRIPVVVASPAPVRAPAPPMLLPMRAVASTGNSSDIDGSLEMVLAATPSAPGATPQPQAQSQTPSRSRGGGGRGGYGGRGGGGYPSASGSEGARGAASLPVTLDLHVSGHIASNALTHMTIAQTRRIQYDGQMYSNISTWTIDLVR
jgi:hypothetical protein